MAFPPGFLDELRARVPISGVVGRKVKLLRRGREHTGLCPFHNEKTPSFTVSDDKGFYHCFGCGAHGDVISFVKETEGLSFPEAVERLAGEAGLEVPRASREEQQRADRRDTLHDVTAAAADGFRAKLAAPEGQEARDYLSGRGLDAATIEAFGLGFAPGQRGLLRKAMNARGIDDERLIEVGLLKRPEDGGALRDYFFDRIVYPINDRQGNVIGFGGRAMGESKAKYLNSPETILFHKGRVLYNLDKARRAARDMKEVIVAEGYMDVIALAQAGFPAAVAPLGTALTETQIGELWRMVREPILCLDGDQAGRRAAFRAAERALPLLRAGHSLQFAFLPEGDDPDTLLRSEGPAAFRTYLDRARPLSEVLWQREVAGKPTDTPERRAALRSALRQSVEAIKDPDLKAEYRTEMERRWNENFGWVRQQRYSGGRSAGSNWHLTEKGDFGRSRSPYAGPLKTRSHPDRLHYRREQLLLATLINHPEILAEFAEPLGHVSLTNRDLDGLKKALVDAVAARPDLDREELKCHLSSKGFSGNLTSLLSPDIYLHGRFARPDADAEGARFGFDHLWREFRDQYQAVDAALTGRDLAADMSENKLDRLKAEQILNSKEEIRPADFDRFETVNSPDQS